MADGYNLQLLGHGTFYLFPRGMFVKVGHHVVRLLCRFDEALDEYKDHYEVSLVIGAAPDDFSSGAAYHREYDLVELGPVPVRDVEFDISRRMSVRSEKLERLVEQFVSSTSP